MSSDIIGFGADDAKALWEFIGPRAAEGGAEIQGILRDLERALWDSLSIEEMSAAEERGGRP